MSLSYIVAEEPFCHLSKSIDKNTLVNNELTPHAQSKMLCRNNPCHRSYY